MTLRVLTETLRLTVFLLGVVDMMSKRAYRAIEGAFCLVRTSAGNWRAFL